MSNEEDRVHSVWKVRENNIPGKAGLESPGKSGIVREIFFCCIWSGKVRESFFLSTIIFSELQLVIIYPI